MFFTCYHQRGKTSESADATNLRLGFYREPAYHLEGQVLNSYFLTSTLCIILLTVE